LTSKSRMSILIVAFDVSAKSTDSIFHCRWRNSCETIPLPTV
jgi:hypothetical protein